MTSAPFQVILAEESRGTRGGFSWIGARQMALLGGLSRVQATEKATFPTFQWKIMENRCISKSYMLLNIPSGRLPLKPSLSEKLVFFLVFFFQMKHVQLFNI